MMPILLTRDTVDLVKKSNELAAIVQDLEAQKKRGWETFHEQANRAHALERRLLEGDMTVFADWAELRRQIIRFMADDNPEGALRRARADYHKAHEAALVAMRKDAGLVWVGF